MDTEDLVFGFFLVLIVVGLFTFVFQLSEASNHDTCHERGELANVEVTYRKWDGCYVKHNGVYDMPYDVWKYNRDHGVIAK